MPKNPESTFVLPDEPPVEGIADDSPDLVKNPQSPSAEADPEAKKKRRKSASRSKNSTASYTGASRTSANTPDNVRSPDQVGTPESVKPAPEKKGTKEKNEETARVFTEYLKGVKTGTDFLQKIIEEKPKTEVPNLEDYLVGMTTKKELLDKISEWGKEERVRQKFGAKETDKKTQKIHGTVLDLFQSLENKAATVSELDLRRFVEDELQKIGLERRKIIKVPLETELETVLFKREENLPVYRTLKPIHEAKAEDLVYPIQRGRLIWRKPRKILGFARRGNSNVAYFSLNGGKPSGQLFPASELYSADTVDLARKGNRLNPTEAPTPPVERASTMTDSVPSNNAGRRALLDEFEKRPFAELPTQLNDAIILLGRLQRSYEKEIKLETARNRDIDHLQGALTGVLAFIEHVRNVSESKEKFEAQSRLMLDFVPSVETILNSGSFVTTVKRDASRFREKASTSTEATSRKKNPFVTTVRTKGPGGVSVESTSRENEGSSAGAMELTQEKIDTLTFEELFSLSDEDLKFAIGDFSLQIGIAMQEIEDVKKISRIRDVVNEPSKFDTYRSHIYSEPFRTNIQTNLLESVKEKLASRIKSTS